MRALNQTGLTLAASLLSTTGVGFGAEAAAARPNILCVVSEDNTFNYVGAYGDPLARTPNLDRVAARGVVIVRPSVFC